MMPRGRCRRTVNGGTRGSMRSSAAESVDRQRMVQGQAHCEGSRSRLTGLSRRRRGKPLRRVCRHRLLPMDPIPMLVAPVWRSQRSRLHPPLIVLSLRLCGYQARAPSRAARRLHLPSPQPRPPRRSSHAARHLARSLLLRRLLRLMCIRMHMRQCISRTMRTRQQRRRRQCFRPDTRWTVPG